MNTVNLHGLRVLNTRPLLQSQELNQCITMAGGLPISCPAMNIGSPDQDWLHLLPNLNDVQQAIFVSANAVTYSIPVLLEKKLAWPEHILVTAVGKGTALALASRQLRVDNIPEISDSEHLLMLNSLQAVHNETILLFKGEGGRTLITDTLTERGAKLIELHVYQRLLPDIEHEKLEHWWRDECVDIILFTSQEAIRNVFAMFGGSAQAWLKRTPCLVISERLAQFASKSGMHNIVICTPDTIMEALNQFNQGRVYGKY